MDSEGQNVGEKRPITYYTPFIISTCFFCFDVFNRLSINGISLLLIEDFQTNAAVVGLFGSSFFYGYAVVQLPMGYFLDRFGCRTTLTVAAALCTLGCITFSLTASAPVAVAARVVCGLGAGGAFLGLVTVLSTCYLETEAGILMGIAAALGNVGGLVAQAPVTYLVSQFGWRTVFLFFSLAPALLCVTFYVSLPRKGEEGKARRGCSAESEVMLTKAASNSDPLLGESDERSHSLGKNEIFFDATFEESEQKRLEKMSTMQKLKVVVSHPVVWGFILCGT